MELSKLKSVKASIISILLSFIILLFGVKIGDRNYWFVSMSLIILAIWLFFSLFESRKPRAREIGSNCCNVSNCSNWKVCFCNVATV